MEDRKQIPGLVGYTIDENGLIFSIKRQGSKGGPVKPHYNSNGYLRVHLRVDGRTIKRFIHHLVAEVFIRERKCGEVLNHKDGNKENNHYSNLEYVTSSENNIHAYKLGLRKPGKHCFSSEEKYENWEYNLV